MNEILIFKDLNTELSLEFTKDKLVYKKYENGHVSDDISDSQKELINQIFFNLLPSKNIKDLGFIKYNSKEIKHLYDIDRNFHLFYENDQEITTDCLKLNYLFNNQEEAVFGMVNNRKRNVQMDFSKFKRQVKVGKKVISVVISASIFLSTSLVCLKVADKVMDYVSYYKTKFQYEDNVSEYENRKILFEEIVYCINKNPNLTEEEKQFFLENEDFLKDNLEYFDYYTTINNLSNFKLVYQKEPCSIPGTYGEYLWDSNGGVMTIYEATNLSDSKKYALSHEFIHLFNNPYGDDNKFHEIVTVILNNEYFGNNQTYDPGYSVLKNYFYIISELIDSDVLRHYSVAKENKILITELNKIIKDNDLAIKLLTNLDFICKAEITRNISYEEYLKLKDEYVLKVQEIENILNIYYKAKYQVTLTDDLYTFYFLKPDHACSYLARELNFDLDTLRYADELTTVKQYKRIFTNTGSDNLILSVCNKVKEVDKYYTKEQILNGETDWGLTEESLNNLPKMEDGTYQVIGYEPDWYMDYELLSYNQKQIGKSK